MSFLSKQVKVLKDKINLLARGIFEYDKPDIVVSEEIVHIEAEMGTLYQGYFDVTSINGLEIRAMIFHRINSSYFRTILWLELLAG